jgi:hypothetical protein
MDRYDDLYAPAFREANSAPPRRKLASLIGLPGILAPSGSAIIHFMHPNLMPIIDVRTVEVLSKAGYIPKRTPCFDDYEKFCKALDDIRRSCPRWSLRQIDRAFFAYHKQSGSFRPPAIQPQGGLGQRT